MSDLGAASGHLLRTLAAVSPRARVVVVGCGEGVHAEAVARLGFDLWACDPDGERVAVARRRVGTALGPDEAVRRVTRSRLDALGYPDGYADWLVFDTAPEADALGPAVAEAARVLAPGAWLWAEGPDAAALLAAAEAAGLVLAEAPASEPGREGAHVILRQPEGVR